MNQRGTLVYDKSLFLSLPLSSASHFSFLGGLCSMLPASRHTTTQHVRHGSKAGCRAITASPPTPVTRAIIITSWNREAALGIPSAQGHGEATPAMCILRSTSIMWRIIITAIITLTLIPCIKDTMVPDQAVLPLRSRPSLAERIGRCLWTYSPACWASEQAAKWKSATYCQTFMPSSPTKRASRAKQSWRQSWMPLRWVTRFTKFLLAPVQFVKCFPFFGCFIR